MTVCARLERELKPFGVFEEVHPIVAVVSRPGYLQRDVRSPELRPLEIGELDESVLRSVDEFVVAGARRGTDLYEDVAVLEEEEDLVGGTRIGERRVDAGEAYLLQRHPVVYDAMRSRQMSVTQSGRIDVDQDNGHIDRL